jgi:2-polyprenyl-6-methoxyphenol hydroxylase-like FAD-dependent oxidoreductase
MTVLIAGAGIGGLTLALSLHQIGVPCRVFESVERIEPLGVGINTLPHAVRELTELGLADQLAATAIETAEQAYFSKHGKPIWSEPRGRAAGYNWPQFSVHRGALQMLLLGAVRERLGADAVLTDHHLAEWDERASSVRVRFVQRASGESRGTQDGTLLVGADGFHSVVRARCYPHEGPPIWTGVILWRGITRGKPFLTGRSVALAGHELQKFVCYPISRAALDRGEAELNWIAELKFRPDHQWRREDWNRPGRMEEFFPRFNTWKFDWLDVPAVIAASDHCYEYPMVDRDPLPRWTHGRVTLLGDAAHPMYPIGSNGASQAILDARVLAREIRAHGVTEAALQAYEAERRPATSAIVAANRANGPDQVLELVEQRAPGGFARVDDVLSRAELEHTAAAYRQVAGFDKDMLNARGPIVM